MTDARIEEIKKLKRPVLIERMLKAQQEVKRLRDAMEKAIRFSSSAGAVRDILSKGLKQALEGGNK